MDGSYLPRGTRHKTVVYRRDGHVGLGNSAAIRDDAFDDVLDDIVSRIPNTLFDVDYAILGVATITDENIDVEWYEDAHVERRQRVTA